MSSAQSRAALRRRAREEQARTQKLRINDGELCWALFAEDGRSAELRNLPFTKGPYLFGDVVHVVDVGQGPMAAAIKTRGKYTRWSGLVFTPPLPRDLWLTVAVALENLATGIMIECLSMANGVLVFQATDSSPDVIELLASMDLPSVPHLTDNPLGYLAARQAITCSCCGRAHKLNIRLPEEPEVH